MSLVNLLPEDFAHRRTARRTNTIALVMFTVVMGGILAGVSVNQRSVNSTRDVLAHVTSEYQDAAKLIEKLNQLDATKMVMQEKNKVTASLVERQPKSYVLALLTNSLPETACITSMKLTPKQAAANNPNQRPGRGPAAKDSTFTEIELMGLAVTDMDVAEMMTKLSSSPLVNKVDLIYSQDKQLDITDPVTNKIVTQRVFRDYKLRIALSPDVDVMDLLGSSDGGFVQREGFGRGEELAGLRGAFTIGEQGL